MHGFLIYICFKAGIKEIANNTPTGNVQGSVSATPPSEYCTPGCFGHFFDTILEIYNWVISFQILDLVASNKTDPMVRLLDLPNSAEILMEDLALLYEE